VLAEKGAGPASSQNWEGCLTGKPWEVTSGCRRKAWQSKGQQWEGRRRICAEALMRAAACGGVR